MAIRLTKSSLDNFELARRPVYDRTEVTTGILHIGIGGFHRAHQAVYTEDVLAAGDLRWGIVGASLRSTTMREKLAPQDFLYTTCTKHTDYENYRVIGAIKDILTLSQHRSRLIDLIASPAIKIIMLTITEKGYCLGVSDLLDEKHPDIVHDLKRPSTPISAPGLLALGLRIRAEKDAGPITIISCDNLSGNGNCTREAVTGISKLQSESAFTWIGENVQFPNTMVDRIVPSTSEDDFARFTNETGYEDKGVVICEPFSQWIIEDKFAAERPEWESAGAQIVDDVAVYEQMKLRMLNATHSALAYLGLLAGYEFIHEVMADPILARFAEYLLSEEITPVIQSPAGFDLANYKDSILERFSNSQIQYRTAQVANDGSQKLPQRIYPSIEVHLSEDKISPGLILAVAAWLQCMTTPTFADLFSDPNGEIIKTYSGGNIAETLSSASTFFGTLGKNERFLNAVASAFVDLSKNAVQEVIQRLSSLQHTE